MQLNNSLADAAAKTLRINAGDLPGFRPSTTPSSRSNSSGSSRRLVWENTIRTNAPAIMKYVGNVAVSAADVLDALTGLNLKPFPIRKANGLGDAMGVVGLDLPVIEGYGRKYYMLLPLVMPAEEWNALSADQQALDRYVAKKNEELQAKPAPVTETEDDQADAA
jgi:hypothetical protein